MWHVYILRSLKNGRLYTGYTGDLEKRLEAHNRGKNRYSRYAGPFELVHSEEFEAKAQAIRRERFLKTGRGREEIAQLLGR